jgi:hypothetical protein
MRLALLALATSLFSYASPASAQIPIGQAERDPELEPEPPRAAQEPLPPAAQEPLPPAPLPAPGNSAQPLPAANGPAPAKADVIVAPSARREAEARAEAEPDAELADELAAAPHSRWYGWQTLIADGASLATIIASASLSDGSDAHDTLAGLGLLGYEFAPGIVHFAHRNPGRGFASFGIRLGMPLAAAFLGASLASGCNTNLCEAGGAGVGVLLGMGGAIAIDAAVFAYDDAKRAPTRQLGWLPVVSVTPHQAWFGLTGTL